jgi:predicted nucleotidyltransferase
MQRGRVPRCRGAEMQRCRGAEVQRCRDAEMQRCRDADMQRYRGTGVDVQFAMCTCTGFAPVVQSFRDDAEVMQRWSTAGA